MAFGEERVEESTFRVGWIAARGWQGVTNERVSNGRLCG